IVRSARAKPREPMFEKGEVKKVKEGRREMVLKGHYKTIRGDAAVTINIHLDTLDEKAWEVLRIEYKDTNKASPASPSQKNIDKLIAGFNNKGEGTPPRGRAPVAAAGPRPFRSEVQPLAKDSSDASKATRRAVASRPLPTQASRAASAGRCSR